MKNNRFENTHLILQKVFEILASGSLLLYPVSEKEYITKIGLIDRENCWLIDLLRNVQMQIDEILNPSNRILIDSIRHKGYLHGITNLTSDKKFEEIKKIIES